jgi:two-component system phosphate regulon sensor histidine kinase PhoR
MAIDLQRPVPEISSTASSTISRPLDTWWARFVPWTLAGRLAITLALIVAAATIGLGIFLDVSIRSLYLDRLEDQLASQANVVGRSLASDLNANPSIATIDPLVKAYSEDINARITIIAPDGSVLGDSNADPAAMNNHLNRPEIAEAVADGAGTVERKSGTVDATYLYVAVQVPGAPSYIAETALPISQVDNAMSDVRRRIAAGTVIAVLVSIGAGLWISRRITGSLNAVRDSAVRVAAGDLAATVEPPSTRELADLANAFNTMTSQVEDLVDESRRARMRWASAFASLGDGMLLVDNNEIVTAINVAGADLLDADPDWAINQAFVVVARDHELTALLRESMQRQEMRRSVIELSHGGLFIEATARPVAGYNERYTIVTLRDVTELRRLESVRREFVANVSHELRTPLASIRAVVETLEGGAIDDPEVAEDFLHRIVGEVDRLAALVDDLLDLARLESGRVHLTLDVLDPLDLLSRAAERLRPQTERARLSLVIDVPPDLPPVLADRARIEQVLLNLVHNAIKFTPAGGSITVRGRVDGDTLVTNVIDTGAGIPEVDLPRLFERFYKADKARRSEGTGLGLAIAKHIVQTHNGAISVQSVLGVGSTFTFTIPLAATAHSVQRIQIHTA